MRHAHHRIGAIALALLVTACDGGGGSAGSAEDHFQRGVAHQEADELEQAVAAYDLALAAQADHLGALFNRGLARIDLEQFEDAVSDFTRAAELAPNDPEVHINLGIARTGLGEHRAAVDDFARAIGLDPQAIDAFVYRAVAWESLGEHANAVADFTAAIDLAPDDPGLYRDRQRVLAAMDEPDLAAIDEMLAEMTDLIAAEPNDVGPRLDRALAFIELEAYDLALADLEAALQAQPQNAAALLARANTLDIVGRSDEALADYTRVVELAPREAATALIARAGIYEDLGAYGEAVKEYRDAIEQSPQSHDALARLAWLLATCPEGGVRDGAQAVALASKACDLTGHTDWFCLDALAAAQAESGMFEQAVQTQQKAAAAAPDDLRGQLHARLRSYEMDQPFRQVVQ